ncbi:MAG TPA: DUF5939 domain-containing protein [Aggregatilineales bacterium]|nr:DUF5939 domain-containing protein [Aggregatilineales bacterium]
MAVEINEAYLDERLAKLEIVRSWSPRVISKLENTIRTADDYDLFRVNPYQYAAERDMNPEEALDLFLYAASMGIFDVEWNLVCAVCGHVVHSLRELNKVHSDFFCDFCAVENHVSLDDYIHVTFSIAPPIRRISYHEPDTLPIEDYYVRYHFSKGLLPYGGVYPIDELFKMLTVLMAELEPGEKKTFTIDLNPGRLQCKDLRHGALLMVVVDDNGASEPKTIPLNVMDGQFELPNHSVAPLRLEVPPSLVFSFPQVSATSTGQALIEVENKMDKKSPVLILFYPQDFQAHFVEFESFLSGKKLLTSQTFRDLFRGETLASDEGIGVQDITLLFTDLKGSTAMYDAIGDLKAYYLVRQHFVTLTTAIGNHAGAVVKTIGDAVMASFMEPVSAVNAAIEMLEEMQELNRNISGDLILKIGIHRGHSIAVSLNDRLDYFGQTVNIAARVQALAEPGEIYITQEVHSYPGVSDILAECTVTSDEVNVKGVREKLKVYEIAVKA